LQRTCLKGDESLDTGIARNLALIQEKIARAAERSGRQPSEVKLVAVTKGVAPERIKEALSCGVKAFGENRVQEFQQKHQVLGDLVEWHFIGHLQRNKAKYLVGKIELLHSLDSLKLAKTLEDLAARSGTIWKVLVQVNVSGEPTKHGIAPSELDYFLEELRKFKGLEVCGLMTIAPYSPNPETVRPVFRKLRQLRDECTRKNPWFDMKHLSMGMSADFEVAVEEGATIVRIGSAIFSEPLSN